MLMTFPLLAKDIIPKGEEPKPVASELPRHPEDVFDELRGMQVHEFFVNGANVFRQGSQMRETTPCLAAVQVLRLESGNE